MTRSFVTLFLATSFAAAAPREAALTVDPASLPPKWSLETSSPPRFLGKAPRTLMYAETIDDTPIADVSVRTYRPPHGEAMPADPREWIRAFYSYKDPAAKTDWSGVEHARFVDQGGRRTLRAELSVPPAANMAPGSPRKDHLVAVWATEVNGRALVLTYDRTVATYKYGIKAVEDLFDQVRPLVQAERAPRNLK